MQNEEKILQILEVIQGDISGLKGDVAELKGRMTKVELCLENQIWPGIQMLAEGHESILEQTASKAEVEAVKDEIDSFKAAIRIAVQAQDQA